MGEKAKRLKGERGLSSTLFALSPVRPFPRRAARGFTLLELMIVISILVILAMIGIAQYQKTVLAAREATLREDLFQMRKMLDQYAADKGELPDSLDKLVEAGYIREVPTDPMTDAKDWQTEFGDDPNSTEGSQGIVNVRSASGETASDGSRYSDW
jgi:general secretion pathway protein G